MLHPNKSSFQELTQPAIVAEGDRKNVLVIGGGFIGLSSAIWLQKSGHTVTLVDKNPPVEGGEYDHASSFGNACTMAYGACMPIATTGILKQVPAMLLDREGPLSIFWRDLPSLSPWLWSFLVASTPAEVSRIVSVLGDLMRRAEYGNAELFKVSNTEHLIRRTGCLHLYRTEKAYNNAKINFQMYEREKVYMEFLSKDEVKELEPNLAPEYYKGVMYGDEYSVDTPHNFAIGLAKAFVDNGGKLIKGMANSLSASEKGINVNINGETATYDNAVVAGGAWSKQLAKTFGDNIRLDTERGYHVLFPENGGLLNTPTCYPETGFYMTPLSEGIRAAGTVELGGLGQPMREVRTAAIEKHVRKYLPGVTKAGREWLGFRPSMPDSLPVISQSATDKRVVYAFGHGHVGLTLAGLTGYMVNNFISNLEQPFDLTPLRADRY